MFADEIEAAEEARAAAVAAEAEAEAAAQAAEEAHFEERAAKLRAEMLRDDEATAPLHRTPPHPRSSHLYCCAMHPRRQSSRRTTATTPTAQRCRPRWMQRSAAASIPMSSSTSSR